MLSLGKEIDYALIALAHLAGVGEVASARDVAGHHDLPVPLVMSILKRLHRGRIVRSTRGVRGGYELAVDLAEVSLYDLLTVVQKPSRAKSDRGRGTSDVASPALLALRHRLNRFLQDIRLSDLIVPGQRIDVPLELVSISYRDRVEMGAVASRDADDHLN